MKEWLAFLSEQVILVIDAMALLVIVAATVEAAIAIARSLFVTLPGRVLREEWLHYSRWLVAALTLQLGADIIETSVSTSWEGIARVSAIAVIRTFLNFFLDRDLDQMRARQRESAARAVVERHQ